MHSAAYIKPQNTISISIFLKSLLLVTCSFVFLCNILFDVHVGSVAMMASVYCVLILSGYLVYISHKNWLLLIIFSIIFISNYSISVAMYFRRIPDNLFTTFADDMAVVVGINILLLFLIIVTALMPIRIKPNEKINIFILEENYNPIICTGIVIILALLLILAHERPGELGGRGVFSPLFEYSLYLFIIGFYYSGRKKQFLVLLIMMLALFGLYNIYFGVRVIFLQIVVSALLMNLSHRVAIRRAFPFIVLAYIVSTGIGLFRDEFVVSFYVLENIFERFVQERFTVDTAYAAYHASIIFIKVSDMYDTGERLYLFGRFLLSMILGGSRVANSSLPHYTRQYFFHWFGGLSLFHLYFYLSWFGVTLISFIIGMYLRVINKLGKESIGAIKCVCIFISSSVYRWYLYEPGRLIRGVGILVLLFCFSHSINLLTKKIKVSS